MNLDDLIELLELEQLEDNLFRARHPVDRERRLYGGQIMAQALMAGERTVDGYDAHSLHGYFLRPGDPKVPAVIRVERSRDGRSFASRRIVVIQKGEAIFTMEASFQRSEEGVSHQLTMPELVPPEPGQIPDYLFDAPFITWRFEFRRLQSETPQPPEQFVWFKANGAVPDAGPSDALLHRALLVYESDNTLLGTSRLPHRGAYDRDRMQVASLDHAMWFHRPVRVDEWLLYAQDSPSTSAGRGLTRGSIFTADGRLVASTVQEGLIRLR